MRTSRGPYSTYLPEVLGALRDGALPLVEGGREPINLVDAPNVAAALERALLCNQADGQRMFVTDGSAVTRRDFVDDLLPLADGCPPLPKISRQQALAMTREEGAVAAAKQAAKRIVQLDEVKAIVKSEEALAKSYRRLATQFDVLPSWLQHRALSLIGMMQAQQPASSGIQTRYSPKVVLHQLRGVHHATERAEAVLGYTPAYRFSRRAWRTTAHGMPTCTVTVGAFGISIDSCSELRDRGSPAPLQINPVFGRCPPATSGAFHRAAAGIHT